MSSSSAAAATAPPPASGTVYGGSTSKQAPFALTLAADRRRLSQAMFYVDARCGDGSEIPYFARAAFHTRAPAASSTDAFGGRRLSRTGSFSFRGAATRTRGKMTLRVVHRIRGTIRKARGSGTFQTTIEIVDAAGTKRASCSTGTLRWKTVSAPGRVFAGHTAAGGPVVVELNATRRKITAFRLGWASSCTAGGFLGLADDIADVTVAANGSFRDSVQEDEPIDGGGKRTVAIALEGRAGRTQASGVYRHAETDRNTAGATIDTCDSGALRWSARSSAAARG